MTSLLAVLADGRARLQGTVASREVAAAPLYFSWMVEVAAWVVNQTQYSFRLGT